MTSPITNERSLSWLALLAIVFLLSAAAACFGPTTAVSLILQGKGDYQIYYNTGAGFNEADHRSVLVDDSAKKLIKLTGLPADISAVRIDPTPGSGGVSICGISRQFDAFPGFSSAESHVVSITAAHQVYLTQSSRSGCQTWVITAGADDPQILGSFDSHNTYTKAVDKLRRLALLFITLAVGIGLFIAYQMPVSARVKLKQRSKLTFKWLDERLAVLFLVLAFLLGTGYVFLTPPGSVPDELSHAGKVARISIGDWVGTDNAGPFPPVAEWYGPFANFPQHSRKFTVDNVFQVATRQLQCARTSAINPDAAAGASPIPYIASSAMYMLTCAAGGNFGTFLFGSRLLNLLSYLAFVATGIRYAGFGRWALFCVALLPMSLYLAASISYDSSMLAGTFCFIGLVSGVYSERITCRTALIPIFMVALFLVFQKPQTGWVFVLSAIAFNRCREQHYSLLKWSFLTILVPLLMHLGWVIASIQKAVVRPDVLAVNGLNSIFLKPWRFADVFFATYTSSGGSFLAKGLVGILGWLDVYLPALGYLAAAAALCSASIIGSHRLGWKSRIYVAVAALAAFIVSNVPFYAFWTQPASSVIQGLQGRYFLTMAAVLVMANPVSVRGSWRAILAIFCIICLVISSLSAYWALQLVYF